MTNVYLITSLIFLLSIATCYCIWKCLPKTIYIETNHVHKWKHEHNTRNCSVYRCKCKQMSIMLYTESEYKLIEPFLSEQTIKMNVINAEIAELSNRRVNDMSLTRSQMEALRKRSDHLEAEKKKLQQKEVKI
jgi:hypothetical protein